jgi:hypothetical protein
MRFLNAATAAVFSGAVGGCRHYRLRAVSTRSRNTSLKNSRTGRGADEAAEVSNFSLRGAYGFTIDIQELRDKYATRANLKW